MEQFAIPIALLGCIAWLGMTYPRLWALGVISGLVIAALLWDQNV